MKKRYFFLIGIAVLVLLILIFSGGDKSYPEFNRLEKIPNDAVKMNPSLDKNPVESYSEEFYDPVPLSSEINSAGGEDSSFILPDGKTLYFFFTPDVNVPVEEQLFDRVTGLYISRKNGSKWTEPERIWLQDPGKLSLEGCYFVTPDDKEMLFCSTREGFTGMKWFSAENVEGKWQNWEVVNFPENYGVGELHVSQDEIYFHSSREGGKGERDIWKMRINPEGTWGEPENIEGVNCERDEGWPALSPDGKELWISRDYALWRSMLKEDGGWSEPEKMFGPLAGEATIDEEGNVYFTHHFFDEDSNMIEADIYFAEKK